MFFIRGRVKIQVAEHIKADRVQEILDGNLLDKEIYISDGNIKLINIPTFSLPAIYTCQGRTSFCTKKCYAKKAEITYKQVAPRRYNNYMLSLQDDFTSNIISLISKKKKLKYFRIHESGDFYNQEYLNKWIHIARTFPNIKFLAFTKSFHLNYYHVPPNMIIRWSIMPDTTNTPTAGLYAYAGNCQMPDNIFECTGQCKEDLCTQCWDEQTSVHFKLH